MFGISKLFKRNAVSDYVEDAVPEHTPTTKAKDDYYADLAAQQAEAARNMIMGPDEMGEAEAEAAVRKIIPRPPTEFVVSREGDDAAVACDTSLADGMAIAEDAAPTSKARMLNAARNSDFYQVYATINPRILRHFVSRAFIGYPACTILGQHEVIGLCCAMPAEDAVAAGYTLSCVSRKHKDGDDHIQAESNWLKDMQELGEDCGVLDTCIKFGTYKRMYGIGIAVPVVELKGGHTFEEEYDPSFVKRGSFKGFTVLDPSKAIWDFDAATLFDPLSPWYQKPEFLRIVTGNCEDRHDVGPERRIHRSWLITSNYREVGEDLLATYQYGGQPLSQILYERVFCADKLANEIVALAMSKRTVVKDGNLKEMVANPKTTSHFIERWNGFRNNDAIAFKEPGEQIMQLETSLSDLQPLSAQQYQYVAAYAGIPMTKLFKNVPSGLQATGQYEVEDYEQTIKPIRKDAVNIINRWYELYIASTYTERDDLGVRVRFNPFVSPKAAEVQQIASQKASMACQLVQNRIVTVTEARQMLRGGEDSVFSCLSSQTPEIIAKIEEAADPEKQQEMQMQQQMAMSGMGGGMPGMGGGAAGGQENPIVTENKGVFAEALKEVLGEGGASSEGNGVAIIGSGEGGTDGDGGNQNEGEAAVPEGGQEGEPTEEGEAKEHEQAE